VTAPKVTALTKRPDVALAIGVHQPVNDHVIGHFAWLKIFDLQTPGPRSGAQTGDCPASTPTRLLTPP
jgi:hypothetical protein